MRGPTLLSALYYSAYDTSMSCVGRAAAGVCTSKRDPSFISLQGKRDRFPSHGGTDYMY